MKKWLFFSTLFAMLLCSSGPAWGCSCFYPKPWQYDLIFEGKVAELVGPDDEQGGRHYRFSVSKAIKGDAGAEVTLYTAAEGIRGCGFYFIVGRSYYVSARKVDGYGMMVDACSKISVIGDK